nr:hypothetical protein [Tanacetum cinerariifolium]
MREIIRDQFATSMNEFMANMKNGAGGSGRAGGSGGTGANAGRTGVRGARPTVPELTSPHGLQLVGQLIQDKADEAIEGEKRKGEGDRGGRGDN